MTVYCHQCGSPNPDWARFCDQCGTALLHLDGQVNSGGPVAQPAVPTQQPATPQPAAAAHVLTCHQCGSGVLPGEAFCDNCGAPLLGNMTSAGSSSQAQVPPQQNYPPPQPFNPVNTPAPASVQVTPGLPPDDSATLPPLSVAPTPSTTYTPPVPAAPSNAPPAVFSGNVRLRIPSHQAMVSLAVNNQLTIGRNDPVSKFYPDLDLTPYGGIENGVGRRHMRLFAQTGQLLAEDLDSTNGTYLNGRRLPAKQSYPVNNHSELRLGSLVIQVEW